MPFIDTPRILLIGGYNAKTLKAALAKLRPNAVITHIASDEVELTCSLTKTLPALLAEGAYADAGLRYDATIVCMFNFLCYDDITQGLPDLIKEKTAPGNVYHTAGCSVDFRGSKPIHSDPIPVNFNELVGEEGVTVFAPLTSNEERLCNSSDIEHSAAEDAVKYFLPALPSNKLRVEMDTRDNKDMRTFSQQLMSEYRFIIVSNMSSDVISDKMTYDSGAAAVLSGIDGN